MLCDVFTLLSLLALSKRALTFIQPGISARILGMRISGRRRHSPEGHGKLRYRHLSRSCLDQGGTDPAGRRSYVQSQEQHPGRSEGRL